MSQQAEDVETKKSQYAYNYFSQSMGAVPVAPPKKLTDEEVAAQQKEVEARSNQGASAWNHAGTFEERSWTEWAKERLLVLVKGQGVSGSGGSQLTVTNLVVDKGHANAWIVRGKKRYGFDFELTVSWTVSVSGKDVSGTAKVPNAASDELDDLCICDCAADTKDAEARGAPAAIKVAEQVLPELLVGQLEVLLEELKQK